jgi:hypothetical protein
MIKVKFVALSVCLCLNFLAVVPLFASPIPLHSKVEKQCEAEWKELNIKKEEYRRCIRFTGGREMIKEAHCSSKLAEEKKSRDRFEQCRLSTMAKNSVKSK